MATTAQWVEGARLRTLPAAVAPVLAGSGAAHLAGGLSWTLSALCAVVALALQIGVNYANDYSDGIRGTDADRVGPLRLVGSGAATPRAVRGAAITSFVVAAAAGLTAIALTGHWWLLGVGAAAIAAAWFYTGGPRPYGYAGLGEVFVFIFFGLVATWGTTYLQVGRLTAAAAWSGIAIGLLACALLVANNLRDVVGDAASGKRTLATRLGDTGTRWFYAALIAGAAVGIIAAATVASAWLALGLVFLALAVNPARRVLSGANGGALIDVLRWTGFAELACGVGLAAGCAIAGA